LYELIYTRFVASQMTPARSLLTTVEIQVDKYILGASGSIRFLTDLLRFTAKRGRDQGKEGLA